MKNQNQNTNQNENNDKTNHTNQSTGTPNSDSAQIESKQRLVLPLMKTAHDAMQLCRLEQDTFYLAAFTIQLWLGETIVGTIAEYAEKKDPRTRQMQSGQAWRIFLATLGYTFEVGPDRRAGRGQDVDFKEAERPAQRSGPTNKTEADVRLDQTHLADFVSDIIRLAEYEDPYADIVREALARYLIENPLNTQTAIDDPTSCIKDPVTCFVRICDWLDSVLHLDNHAQWHLLPEAYDPDPEKRELFSLGRLQRNFDIATDVEKAHWQWHYGDAIKQHADSPKLSALAAGLSSTATRVWDYEDVDCAVITLWPLVKRHNWTYADLLKVIRPKVKRPNFYPCDTEQSISAYCINVLGLRKTGKGRTAKSEPVGMDVARRLLGIAK